MDDLPIIKLRSNIKEEIPEAYIKGWIEFYKLKFKLTPDTLIPRPETELLVDEVLGYILRAQREVKTNNNNPTILDIGTGSGNIAISLAKNLPKAKIFATDISPDALAVAKLNARYHRMDKRIFFIESDLLELFSGKSRAGRGVADSRLSESAEGGRVGESRRPTKRDASERTIDIIVTNLPYIPTSRIPTLDPSVKDFEPKIALDGGADGFELYRKLFFQMLEKNIIPKVFIGEIDDTHGDIALKEAKQYFPKARAEIKLDLAKRQRILLIKF